MEKKLLLLVFTLVLFAGPALAQSYNDEAKEDLESLKPGTTNFLLRGYSHAGFQSIDGNSSFVSGQYAPILMWKQGDKILFESELEIEFEGDGVQFALEYANISYILNDYAILRVGNFLTPFGTFNDRIHPAWINKLSTAPLGMGHDPVGPTSEFGAELRGAADLGSSKFNYSLYLSNGSILSVHDEDSTTAPEVSLSGLNFEDNNNEKAVGGRFGFLPFNNSALELGVSAQYTSNIANKDFEYGSVGMLNYAFDLSFVKNSIQPIKGNIDVKAQWNQSNIDEFELVLPDGDELIFDHKRSAYYAQIAYRPSLSSSPFLSKLEFVGRYSGIDLPEAPDEHGDETAMPKVSDNGAGNSLRSKSLFTPEVVGGGEEEEVHNEGDRAQIAFGINYWITWRSVIKFSYQITDNNEEAFSGIYLHYALGF